MRNLVTSGSQITDDPKITPQPVPVSEPAFSSEPSSGGNVQPIAVQPEHRLDSSLWSWDQSIRDKITRLSINKEIRAIIEHDASFHNWIKTCIAQHVANDLDETVCPFPDRFREYGGKVTIVTANYLPGKANYAGGVEAHTFQQGVYHVMNGG